MMILSIDSGIEKTGYALFKTGNYLKSGLIRTSKHKSIEKRLQEIYQKMQKIINIYHPEIIVLERLFFFRNQKTAISVSQAQGIILLLAAQNNIYLEYLTPLQIKQVIAGYGKADKKSIQKMLKLTTDIPSVKEDDEADAIACGLAYCYLNQKLLK